MRHVGLLVSLLTLCQLAQAEPLPSTTGAVGPPPHTDPTQRELARRCFALGVSLAQAGRYAAAKAVFLEAYAAEPHYVVLYNIAQADVQLGDLASDASSLRQYLEAGGRAISPDWRQEVESEIARIDALQAAALEADAAAQAPGGSSAGVVEGSDANAGDVTSYVAEAPLAAETQTATTGRMLATGGTHLDGGAPTDNARGVGGYLLAVGGFAVLGGAVGLYLWNHERHNQWREEHEALLAARSSVIPENEAVINEWVRANNSRLASIKSFDAVPIITGGVGIAALGAGLWMLLKTPAPEHVRVSSGPSELDVRVRWVW